MCYVDTTDRHSIHEADASWWHAASDRRTTPKAMDKAKFKRSAPAKRPTTPSQINRWLAEAAGRPTGPIFGGAEV